MDNVDIDVANPPLGVPDTPLPPQPRPPGNVVADVLAPSSDARPRSSFVYALGQIEPRFPSLGIEKEFAQAVGRSDGGAMTDRQALQSVLGERANRYLARQMCWVFTIEGLETYILVPRDPADLDLFIEAVRPRPTPADVDVVIGVLGPLADAGQCNGLVLPLVAVDNVYSFERDELVAAIPRPEDAGDDEQFRASAEEVLDRVMQLADNAGATNEHRALNYVSVRYPAIYARTAQAHRDNRSLSSVEVRPSRLSGSRDVVDAILSYTDRSTDATEKYFVRVDVTEEFPFLVSKLAPYYER